MTPDARKALKAAIEARIKQDDKFRRAARAWLKANDPGAGAELPLITKSADALRAVRSHDDGLFGSLDRRRADIEGLVNVQLERRREELLHAAQKAGCPAQRRQEYDHIDCFKVMYRRARVTLQLGSEKWDTFDETDGRRVFARVQEARSALDRFPFSRDAFFDIVKSAIGIARVEALDRDGKVPIGKLHPWVALVRQSRDRAFMKQPSARRYGEYPLGQFIYDLARFGQSGWLNGRGERLSSQTPNMATIARGNTVTLPVLQGTAPGAQIAALWIEKA